MSSWTSLFAETFTGPDVIIGILGPKTYGHLPDAVAIYYLTCIALFGSLEPY